MTKKITEKQIQEWKEKFGGVYELPVDDKTGYLREPKMLDFKRAMSAMKEDGEIGFGEILLRALFIGGDEDIIKNDEYFLPARQKLIRFFEFEDADVTSQDCGKTQITVKGRHCTVRVITREDLRLAEKKNPSSKPFVTQEKLFELIKVEADEVFNDRDNAEIRFPLYKALEQLQNKKVAAIKKL